MRLAAVITVLTGIMQHVLLQSMTATAGEDNAEYTKEWERNLNVVGENDFEQSELCTMNLFLKKNMVRYYFRSTTEGQFLFDSIIISYKNQTFIYTAIFWILVLNFSRSNKKRKSSTTSKQIRSKEHELLQHLIHPETRVSMRSSFTYKRTKQLSAWQVN